MTTPEYYSEFKPAFAAAIDAVEPDVVYAHDYPTIGIARAAADRARASGRRLPWIYDAHEYVRGLDILAPHKYRAIRELEERHLPFADHVVTVSDAVALRLQADYGLTRPPTVVLNTPRLDTRVGIEYGTIRRRLRLDEGVPLLVYHGGVKEARGIHTLVEALPALADAHLGIMTNDDGPYLNRLRDLATQNGSRGRLHVLPYVPSDHVAHFIADATLGVHPYRRYGNVDVALPNKLFECMHARLPVVCSDAVALTAFLRETGIGEVFRAEDPDDLVRAVQQVIAERDRYVKAVTPALLECYSWEQQERVLIGIYRDLLGDSCIAPAPIAP